MAFCFWILLFSKADFYAMVKCLILSLLLIKLSVGAVYYVKPSKNYNHNENHYCTTKRNCRKLNDYAHKGSTLLTSNAHLIFLSGEHSLNTNLNVQNLHNVSLTGSSEGNTIIRCSSLNGAAIVIINTSNITISNLEVSKCKVNYINILYKNNYKKISKYNFQIRKFAALAVFNSYSIQIDNISIADYGMVLINVLGNSTVHKAFLSKDGIVILYIDYDVTDINTSHTLLLQHFHYTEDNTTKPIFYTPETSYALFMHFYQETYTIHLLVSHTSFQSRVNVKFILIKFFTCSCNFSALNFVHFDSLKIANNVARMFNDKTGMIYLVFSICSLEPPNPNCTKPFSLLNTVKFANSIVSNNTITNNGGIILYVIAMTGNVSFLQFVNSTFNNNTDIILIFMEQHFLHITDYYPLNIAMTNVTITSLLGDNSQIMYSLGTNLALTGPVVFNSVIINQSMFDIINVKLYLHGYIEISNCTAKSIIHSYTDTNMFINEGTLLSITSNRINGIMFDTKRTFPRLDHPCFIQYISNNNKSLDKQFQEEKKLNYSIIFDSNIAEMIYHLDRTIYCKWLPDTAFRKVEPKTVNEQFVHLINQSSDLVMKDHQSLCPCNVTTRKGQPNCYVDELERVYPGQTIMVHFELAKAIDPNADVTVDIVVDTKLSDCIVSKADEARQKFHEKTCNKFSYTILSNKKIECKLVLKTEIMNDLTDLIEEAYSVFFIPLSPCPVGFVLYDLRCQCDPVLLSATAINIIGCNPNDETIMRPANSWISPIAPNVYKVCPQCPFDYCLPHSSNHILSDPNSQCQFERSGLLCGHCLQGLSSVFGSSHCKHCSSVYLLLVIPIAVAGIGIVLMLFIFNLTVTDGNVNPFIFYVNIISINSTLFFPPSHQSFNPAYVAVSLATLDLGIQVCFYNGMDEYAKMWLQLVFPMYLILIATSLIVASRYSSTIQKLTAQRALPVLATLFLLSYTKILRTISTVLFVYSTTTQIPSTKAEFVWSVDANVNLFGFKHAALFVICLLLLLSLIPFNIVLLLTRTLLRFRVVSYFKPLLDAYQGPYEDNCYYWTGLQLLIRTIIFSVSALETNISLYIGCLVLGILGNVQCYAAPFKSKKKNFHERFFILNLMILYSVSSLQSITYTQQLIINTTIYIAVLYFVFIVVFHIAASHCGITTERIRNAILRPNEEVVVERYDLGIPEVAHNYAEFRETLLGEFNTDNK